MLSIGEWVLESACLQAANWRRHERVRPTMSINVSARELGEGDIAERVRAALIRSDLPAAALCVEITEEAIMSDLRGSRAALEKLKRLGVHIALDNFGTGSSSLSLPGTVPVDTLKIDRGLIHGLEHDPHQRGMVTAMVSLAREMKLRLVAMGIESERQLKLVRRIGCPVGQGFLLAPPQVPV